MILKLNGWQTMKTKHEIITAMCVNFRHDYGLPKENYRIEGTHSPLSPGMTKQEQETLYNTMLKIYTNAIEPYMVNRGEAYIPQPDKDAVLEREKFHFQIQFLEERLAHSDEQLVKAMDMLGTLMSKLK